METIKLGDKTLNLKYTMRTAVAYERMTGNNPFDLQQFSDGHIEHVISLGYALLVTSNDPKDVPEFDDLMGSISDVNTMTELINKVGKVLGEFFGIQPGDKVPEGEGDPKNA